MVVENNKSSARLTIYLVAAIWVFLLFYCTLSKPTLLDALLQLVVVQVTNFVVINIFLGRQSDRSRLSRKPNPVALFSEDANA